MEKIETGSNEWVKGILDWEGWPDAIEHINPAEIQDEAVSVVWGEATVLYNALDTLWMRLIKILGEEETYE